MEEGESYPQEEIGKINEGPIEREILDAFKPLTRWLRQKGESSYQAVYGLLAFLGHRTLEISARQRNDFFEKISSHLGEKDHKLGLNVLLCGACCPKTVREFARWVSKREEKINPMVLDLYTTAFIRNKIIGRQEGIEMLSIKANALKLPMESGTISFILNDTLLNMFELPQIEKFAKEVFRVLSKNGGAFLTYETGTIIDRFMPGGNVYPLDQIKRIFKEVGLETEITKTARTPLHVTSNPFAIKLMKK